jgi:hypothetical protein
MPSNAMTFDITFRDFRFLQGYMMRRIFTRNRGKYAGALAGVVLCAVFLALAIVINVNPHRAIGLAGFSIRYPLSVYLLIIFSLVAAIVCLFPAVRLRLNTLRLQVSDNGPFLGPTSLTIEPDGLTVDRKVMRAKYLWAAFQGVEIARNAVILPLDNGIGLIIPATAFSSDAARYDFAATVSKHIADRAAGAF